MTTGVNEKTDEISVFFLPVFTVKADSQTFTCTGTFKKGMGQEEIEEQQVKETGSI